MKTYLTEVSFGAERVLSASRKAPHITALLVECGNTSFSVTPSARGSD